MRHWYCTLQSILFAYQTWIRFQMKYKSSIYIDLWILKLLNHYCRRLLHIDFFIVPIPITDANDLLWKTASTAAEFLRSRSFLCSGGFLIMRGSVRFSASGLLHGTSTREFSRVWPLFAGMFLSLVVSSGPSWWFERESERAKMNAMDR